LVLVGRSALAALPPDRALSFIEVTLYCLLRHLEFRNVLPITPYANLSSFGLSFESRESIRSTEFKFDA
jgi:hypothetical protein